MELCGKEPSDGMNGDRINTEAPLPRTEDDEVDQVDTPRSLPRNKTTRPGHKSKRQTRHKKSPQPMNLKSIYDRNSDDILKTLDIRQFAAALQEAGHPCTFQQANSLMKLFDLNADGQISFLEFRLALSPKIGLDACTRCCSSVKEAVDEQTAGIAGYVGLLKYTLLVVLFLLVVMLQNQNSPGAASIGDSITSILSDSMNDDADFKTTDDIISFIGSVTATIFTAPSCGDGVCTRPDEYPSWEPSVTGDARAFTPCEADCGTLNTTTIYTRVTFADTEKLADAHERWASFKANGYWDKSMSGFGVSDQDQIAGWNICSRDKTEYGHLVTVCLFDGDGDNGAFIDTSAGTLPFRTTELACTTSEIAGIDLTWRADDDDEVLTSTSTIFKAACTGGVGPTLALFEGNWELRIGVSGWELPGVTGPTGGLTVPFDLAYPAVGGYFEFQRRTDSDLSDDALSGEQWSGKEWFSPCPNAPQCRAQFVSSDYWYDCEAISATSTPCVNNAEISEFGTPVCDSTINNLIGAEATWFGNDIEVSEILDSTLCSYYPEDCNSVATSCQLAMGLCDSNDNEQPSGPLEWFNPDQGLQCTRSTTGIRDGYIHPSVWPYASVPAKTLAALFSTSGSNYSGSANLNAACYNWCDINPDVEGWCGGTCAERFAEGTLNCSHALNGCERACGACTDDSVWDDDMHMNSQLFHASDDRKYWPPSGIVSTSYQPFAAAGRTDDGRSNFIDDDVMNDDWAGYREFGVRTADLRSMDDTMLNDVENSNWPTYEYTNAEQADGWCDTRLNSLFWRWDMGDCCYSTCVANSESCDNGYTTLTTSDGGRQCTGPAAIIGDRVYSYSFDGGIGDDDDDDSSTLGGCPVDDDGSDGGDDDAASDDDTDDGSDDANDDGSGGDDANDDGSGGDDANDDGSGGDDANDDGSGGDDANDDGSGGSGDDAGDDADRRLDAEDCPESCFGYSCEVIVADEEGFTCYGLESVGCDCTGCVDCGCSPSPGPTAPPTSVLEKDVTWDYCQKMSDGSDSSANSGMPCTTLDAQLGRQFFNYPFLLWRSVLGIMRHYEGDERVDKRRLPSMACPDCAVSGNKSYLSIPFALDLSTTLEDMSSPATIGATTTVDVADALPVRSAMRKRALGGNLVIVGPLLYQTRTALRGMCDAMSDYFLSDLNDAGLYCTNPEISDREPMGIDATVDPSATMFSTAQPTGVYRPTNSKSLGPGFTYDQGSGRSDDVQYTFPVLFDVNFNDTKAQQLITYLDEGMYIDEKTSTLNFLLVMFNPEAGLWVVTTLLWEPAIGGVWDFTQETSVVSFNRYFNNADVQRAVVELLFVFVLSYFVLSEVAEIVSAVRGGLAGFGGYFSTVENWLDIATYSCMITAVVYWCTVYFGDALDELDPATLKPSIMDVYRDFYATGATDGFVEMTASGQAHYERFFSAITSVVDDLSMYQGIVSIAMMLTLGQLITKLGFHPKLGIISRTLAAAQAELTFFFVLFIIITLIFTVLAFMLFGQYFSDEYGTLMLAFENTLILVMVGAPDAYSDMYNTNGTLWVLTRLWYWLYIIVVFFILLNVRWLLCASLFVCPRVSVCLTHTHVRTLAHIHTHLRLHSLTQTSSTSCACFRRATTVRTTAVRRRSSR